MTATGLDRWAPAHLISASPAAAEQVWLDVQPPDEFVQAHTRPGQFCKIRVAGEEGMFAMLSAPGDAPRFLVRVGNPKGGKAADALAALASGTAIEMSLPGGAGFGLEAARGADLRFVATGTGVAPVCAAIDHVLRRRGDFGAISLDHGIKSEAHLAIGEHIARWRTQGIEVRVSYSALDENGAVVGTTVQQALKAACPDLSGSVVVGVGQSGMITSLRQVVTECGGDPDSLLTNY